MCEKMASGASRNVSWTHVQPFMEVAFQTLRRSRAFKEDPHGGKLPGANDEMLIRQGCVFRPWIQSHNTNITFVRYSLPYLKRRHAHEAISREQPTSKNTGFHVIFE